MRFPTNFLSIFNVKGGTQDVRDGIVEVPRTLLPVIQLPEALNRFSVSGDTVATQLTSFAISHIVQQTNGAGTNALTAIVGAGVWDILITVTFNANYTDLVNFHYVQMVGTPAATNFRWFQFLAQTQMVVATARQVIVIPKGPTDTQNFSLSLGANGVGQTVSLAGSIIGNRIG